MSFNDAAVQHNSQLTNYNGTITIIEAEMVLNKIPHESNILYFFQNAVICPTKDAVFMIRMVFYGVAVEECMNTEL